MLRTEIPPPFPLPGSAAFLKPQGLPVRINQRRSDGRVFITRDEPRYARSASTELTVEFADLAEHRHEAIVVAPRKPKPPVAPKVRKARKPRAKAPA